MHEWRAFALSKQDKRDLNRDSINYSQLFPIFAHVASGMQNLSFAIWNGKLVRNINFGNDFLAVLIE